MDFDNGSKGAVKELFTAFMRKYDEGGGGVKTLEGEN